MGKNVSGNRQTVVRDKRGATRIRDDAICADCLGRRFYGNHQEKLVTGMRLKRP